MINPHTRHYLAIWYWLMGLVILSVLASFILPKTQALILIFAAAVVKALLVARNYMHLKNEKPIIYAMALVPLALILIFLFALFPDFVYHSTRP
ncbi:MAG: cytochrome C oxidase subunit IV family protein [Deltaproteobacteria bacterium]|nr:cytochrome C oxidase subunit IV family protein [Deltaproteobacteria bacterium]